MMSDHFEGNVRKRAYNFSAGPAAIFPEILADSSKEVVSYKDAGVSILELGHRTQYFADLEEDASRLAKKLMDIPQEYDVLWMQGGATAMFSSVVYNFYRGPEHPICFVISGNWSNLALKEAEKLGAKCEVIKRYSVNGHHDDTSVMDKMDIIKNASYVYYCDNETVTGLEFPAAGSKSDKCKWMDEIPESVPVICDMTSNIASRTFRWSRFGAVFASTQKNLGTSGVTLVVVKKEFISQDKKQGLFFNCPTILDMNIMLKSRSAYNTPPVFQISLCRNVLRHSLSIGGVDYFEQKNKKLIDMISEVISSSNGYYHYLVDKSFRSRMNIVIRICPNRDGVESVSLEKEAIKFAKEFYNIIGIEGHRSIGGIRISLYNAVEVDHVSKLCQSLTHFMNLKSSSHAV